MAQYYFTICDRNEESLPFTCRSLLDAFRLSLKKGIKDGDTVKVYYIDHINQISFHRFFIFLHPFFLCYHDSRKDHRIYFVGDNNEVFYK